MNEDTKLVRSIKREREGGERERKRERERERERERGTCGWIGR